MTRQPQKPTKTPKPSPKAEGALSETELDQVAGGNLAQDKKNSDKGVIQNIRG